MTPADLRLVASVLGGAIKDGTARPELALRMVTACLGPMEGTTDQKLGWRQDFLRRAAPPAKANGGGVGKVDPGREAPPLGRPTPPPVEGDAVLFQAILATDFPEVAASVRCAFVTNLPSRFSVGRVGPQVWIRFGAQALKDPIGAVASAAPEAQAMVSGRTSATQIVGR